MNKYGFIPKRNKIPGRPELSLFPFNVLFMSYARIDGVLKSGTALYEPAIDTYANDGVRAKLLYSNIYNRDPENIWSIKIIYDREKNLYIGLKFRNADQVTESVHRNWNFFFGLWTGQGLQKGESCYFRPVND
jgi:hypothetical protein